MHGGEAEIEFRCGGDDDPFASWQIDEPLRSDEREQIVDGLLRSGDELAGAGVVAEDVAPHVNRRPERERSAPRPRRIRPRHLSARGSRLREAAWPADRSAPRRGSAPRRWRFRWRT